MAKVWKTYGNGLYKRLVNVPTRSKKKQQAVRKKLIEQRGDKCEWCGYPGHIIMHHIIEAQNGGTFDDDNLLLLCEKCHAEAHGWKKKNWLDEARQYWDGDNAAV